MTDSFPITPPDNPFDLLGDWLAQARAAAAQPNPHAMTLVSVANEAGEAAPSARIVLCRGLDVAAGYLVFYTNYRSRKGRELAGWPKAAAVFHWDHAGRQIRVEGRVTRSPGDESDAYFASRGIGSRIGAWASEQSESVSSRAAMEARVKATAMRFGASVDDDGMLHAPATTSVPRPAHWGGCRLWAHAVELWSEGELRIHERLRWERGLDVSADEPAGGEWSWRRLQP